MLCQGCGKFSYWERIEGGEEMGSVVHMVGVGVGGEDYVEMGCRGCREVEKIGERVLRR